MKITGNQRKSVKITACITPNSTPMQKRMEEVQGETFEARLTRLCTRQLPRNECIRSLVALDEELEQSGAVTGLSVHGLALAFREIQDYDGVIRVCQKYREHPCLEETATADLPGGQDVGRVAILVQLAGALARAVGQLLRGVCGLTQLQSERVSASDLAFVLIRE